jgi:AraC-like DNA-binding protein
MPRVLYKEYRPNTYLRPFIKCYWILEKDYAPNEVERVLPDSCFELIYQRGTPFSRHGVALPQLFFVGQLKRPLDVIGAKGLKQWCVRFLPWGLTPFGNVTAIKNQETVEASKVLRETSRELISLLKKGTNQTFINILDEYFLNQLLRWRFTDEVVMRAAEEISKKQGAVKVKDLAKHCWTSQRQLERRFMKSVGHTPIEIVARVRFERARNSLVFKPDWPLADLALECGYSDQAHFIKDFKRFTDMTPSAFVKELRRLNLQNEPDVAFLQS